MSGLRLKWYAKSGMLRSVGAPPNGLVAIDVDRGSFIVHPKAHPQQMPKGGEVRVEFHCEDPVVDGGASLITAEEAVEAASDGRTAMMLFKMTMFSVQHAHRLACDFNVDPLEAMSRLAREVRDQLAVNGYISRQGP